MVAEVGRGAVKRLQREEGIPKALETRAASEEGVVICGEGCCMAETPSHQQQKLPPHLFHPISSSGSGNLFFPGRLTSQS